MNPKIEQEPDLLAINERVMRMGFRPPAGYFYRPHPLGTQYGYFRVGIADTDHIKVALVADGPLAHTPTAPRLVDGAEIVFASVEEFEQWAAEAFGIPLDVDRN